MTFGYTIMRQQPNTRMIAYRYLRATHSLNQTKFKNSTVNC